LIGNQSFKKNYESIQHNIEYDWKSNMNI